MEFLTWTSVTPGYDQNSEKSLLYNGSSRRHISIVFLWTF